MEEPPHFVEVWNEYDPSMRFAAIFPVGERQGATSSILHPIIERKHTGHSDNAEEIAFIAEGEGEVFSIGKTERLEAGKFVVFQPGFDHDIYAQGSVCVARALALPDAEILSTFQQIFPVGGNLELVAASGAEGGRARPEQPARGLPVLTRRNGLADSRTTRPHAKPTMTELLGMHEPGSKPRSSAPSP